MFVKSNMSVEAVYNTNGNAIVIKPRAVTYIADELVSPQELISCYGSRISILSPKLVEQLIKEDVIKTNKEEAVEPEATVTIEPAREVEPTVVVEPTVEPTIAEEGTRVAPEPTKEPEAPKPTKEPVAKQPKKSATKKGSNKKNK